MMETNNDTNCGPNKSLIEELKTKCLVSDKIVNGQCFINKQLVSGEVLLKSKTQPHLDIQVSNEKGLSGKDISCYESNNQIKDCTWKCREAMKSSNVEGKKPTKGFNVEGGEDCTVEGREQMEDDCIMEGKETKENCTMEGKAEFMYILGSTYMLTKQLKKMVPCINNSSKMTQPVLQYMVMHMYVFPTYFMLGFQCWGSILLAARTIVQCVLSDHPKNLHFQPGYNGVSQLEGELP